MLAIAILIGLALWVLITLVAIVIGVKIAGLKGAFAGFMLTMGGWFVYWAGEYVYIQHKVTQLCESEGGITVYVTPEQWRKQIGEAEWANLPEDWKNIDHSLEFKFAGKTYYSSTQLNRRVFSYEAKDERKDIIRDSDTIYLDSDNGQVLFREHYFSVGAAAIANGGLKFWLNEIDDCYIGDWSYDDRFFSDEYTNRQTK